MHKEEYTIEKQFSQCLNQLRNELNRASWHFETYKILKKEFVNYRVESIQASTFWGLTLDSHSLITITLLNRFFDKEDEHLSIRELLNIAEQNLFIFSDERFFKRLNEVNIYNRDIPIERQEVNIDTINKQRITLNDLPVSNIRNARNRALAHINKKWVVENRNIWDSLKFNDKHIQKIINSLDDILNYYHNAFEAITWEKDIPLENSIDFTFSLIQKGWKQYKGI